VSLERCRRNIQPAAIRAGPPAGAVMRVRRVGRSTASQPGQRPPGSDNSKKRQRFALVVSGGGPGWQRGIS
jgi:hypothetical protein